MLSGAWFFPAYFTISVEIYQILGSLVFLREQKTGESSCHFDEPVVEKRTSFKRGALLGMAQPPMPTCSCLQQWVRIS